MVHDFLVRKMDELHKETVAVFHMGESDIVRLGVELDHGYGFAVASVGVGNGYIHKNSLTIDLRHDIIRMQPKLCLTHP